MYSRHFTEPHSIKKLLSVDIYIYQYTKQLSKPRTMYQNPGQLHICIHYIDIFERNSEKFTSGIALRLHAWSLQKYNIR